MRREAAVPIDDELEAEIRAQQGRVPVRWPDTHRQRRASAKLEKGEGALVGMQGAPSAAGGSAETFPAATSRRTRRISRRVVAGHQFGV